MNIFGGVEKKSKEKKRNQKTAKPSLLLLYVFLPRDFGRKRQPLYAGKAKALFEVCNTDAPRLICASVMQRHVPHSPGDNGSERQDETVPALVWQPSTGSHHGLGALLMPPPNSCLGYSSLRPVAR